MSSKKDLTSAGELYCESVKFLSESDNEAEVDLNVDTEVPKIIKNAYYTVPTVITNLSNSKESLKVEREFKECDTLTISNNNAEGEIENKNSNDPENTEPDLAAQGWRSYIGLGLTLCSGLMFAIVGLIVKYLKGQHVLNLGFFRFIGMVIPSLPLVIHARCWQKKKIFDPIWPVTEPQKLKTMAVLFGRAFVGFAAVISHFLSIQHMPVADAMVIGSCSSVFITIVAHIFLGEKCGIFPILTALLLVCGVGIIARPPLITGQEEFNVELLIGTGFALGRMVFTSAAIIFVRYLRGVHAAVVVFSIGALQLLQNTSIALILQVLSIPEDPFHLFLCIALGLISFASQMALTLALKCEQAGPFAIVRTSSDTIFAFILQFLVLGIIPDIYSVIGAVVVLTAVFLTVFRKWLTALPKEHQARQTYSFVLR